MRLISRSKCTATLLFMAVAAGCSGESTPEAATGVAGASMGSHTGGHSGTGTAGRSNSGQAAEAGDVGAGTSGAANPGATGGSSHTASAGASGSTSAAGGLDATGGFEAAGAGSGAASAGRIGASAGANATSAGSGGLDGVGKLKAYLVITGKGTPTPGDQVVIARIKARGFDSVSTVTDALVSAASVADAALIVISSSAESGPLKSKLRTVPLPVLVLEDAEFSLMGMAASGDHDPNISQLALASGASALVGTASGTVTFSSKPGDLGWAAGTTPDSVLLGATMPGNPAHAVIFGYTKGAQMPGLVAPARRAGFAIREKLAANLNQEGLGLLDAVLEWVKQ